MCKIAFLGGGKMAEGILSAMTDRSSVIVAEKISARCAELHERYGVTTTDDLVSAVNASDLVFLAVRPQDAATVAQTVKPVLTERHTIVSIVAGKRIAGLRELFGERAGIIRVMPNLALRAKAGMCAICADCGVGEAQVSAVKSILDGAGATVILEESAFDAVTALSGSGPAYFAYMEAAMAAGGEALGLSPEVARLLAEQTMYGTALFLKQSGMDLNTFIAGVCTKGGTTAAGMEKMDADGVFRKIVAETLAAAAKRSEELA